MNARATERKIKWAVTTNYYKMLLLDNDWERSSRYMIEISSSTQINNIISYHTTDRLILWRKSAAHQLMLMTLTEGFLRWCVPSLTPSALWSQTIFQTSIPPAVENFNQMRKLEQLNLNVTFDFWPFRIQRNCNSFSKALFRQQNF